MLRREVYCRSSTLPLLRLLSAHSNCKPSYCRICHTPLASLDPFLVEPVLPPLKYFAVPSPADSAAGCVAYDHPAARLLQWSLQVFTHVTTTCSTQSGYLTCTAHSSDQGARLHTCQLHWPSVHVMLAGHDGKYACFTQSCTALPTGTVNVSRTTTNTQ